MLCWRLGLCQRAAAVPVLDSHSLGLGGFLSFCLSSCSLPQGTRGPSAHMLSAVLTVPYMEMLTLTRLQETLHWQLDQVIPDQSRGTACNAWSLLGLAAQACTRQRDGCQGWQAEGKAKAAVAKAHLEGR